MATFLDELARLNSQNFLGGFAQAGQALAEQKRGETVANLYNEFASKRSGLATTDEQIAEFNEKLKTTSEEEINGGNVGGIINSISEATLNLDKIYQQTGAYENLFRPYITAFATLGDEGINIANTLSRELESKKELLEKKANIPFKQLEYENALYNKANNKMQLISGAITLDKLKSDTEATNLLMDIMDTEVGKQIFTFDTATGGSSFKPRDMYMKLQKIYGDSPAFGKAWLMLEKHIYDNMQRYDSASMLRATKGSGEGLDNVVTTYSIMRSMTDKYGQLNNDSKYSWVRQAYIDQATLLGKTDLSHIGSDPEVINSIENAGAKKELEWLYKHFYNNTDEENYWKYANVLKTLTGIKQVKFDENIIVKGLPVPLDMSKLITKDGGWWNPYETPVHYTQYERSAIREQTGKAQSQEKSKQFSNYAEQFKY